MKSPITSSYSEASGRVVGSKLAALLCAAAVLPMAAMAAVTVYVGGDGASDDNAGTSPTAPFATIEKAMDRVNAEDDANDSKVYVRTGTYNVTAVKSFNKGQRMGWPLNLRPARR